MDTNDQRLAQLEQSLRRTKALLFLVGAGVGVVLLTSAVNPPSNHYDTKTLNIMDDNGKIAAVLTSSNGRGHLYLKRASDGATFIDLGSTLLDGDRCGGAIQVGDGQKTSVEIGLSNDANGLLAFKNHLGWKSLELTAQEDGGRITIFQGEPTPLSGVVIESKLEDIVGSAPKSKERLSRIELRSTNEQIQVHLDNRNQAGSVQTFDKNGRTDKMPHAK